MKKITIISLIFFVFSCVEKEIPKPKPHIPGDVSRAEVFINADYKYQVFYNLKSNTAISKNLKTDWDFSIDSENQYIKLNGSKFMLGAKTMETDLSKLTSKTGITFYPDQPSGYVQDLSIGKWEENKIYVLDRGYNSDGKQLGFAKIKLYHKDGKLYVDYALLASAAYKSIEIISNKAFDATYISIEKGIVSIAPEKDLWHLCFTQYTHVFEDETPYLVTGVLINAKKCLAKEVVDSDFLNINLENTKSIIYTDSAAVIGYDWKMYSFETASFTTDTERNYMVKVSDEYFKLHFLDFYNAQGEKGNFFLEYQKL